MPKAVRISEGLLYTQTIMLILTTTSLEFQAYSYNKVGNKYIITIWVRLKTLVLAMYMYKCIGLCVIFSNSKKKGSLAIDA